MGFGIVEFHILKINNIVPQGMKIIGGFCAHHRPDAAVDQEPFSLPGCADTPGKILFFKDLCFEPVKLQVSTQRKACHSPTDDRNVQSHAQIFSLIHKQSRAAFAQSNTGFVPFVY